MFLAIFVEKYQHVWIYRAYVSIHGSAFFEKIQNLLVMYRHIKAMYRFIKAEFSICDYATYRAYVTFELNMRM